MILLAESKEYSWFFHWKNSENSLVKSVYINNKNQKVEDNIDKNKWAYWQRQFWVVKRYYMVTTL